MATDKRIQPILKALEEAQAESPTLEDYYEFHRALLQSLDEAKSEISATLELADEEALRARLLQGLPLISFEQLPIAAEGFAELASDVFQLLLDYAPGLPEGKLPDDPAECVALARQQFDEGQMIEGEDEEPAEKTLARIAVDMALKPYLAWAAEQALPHVEQKLWKRSHCPICGGAPDFATLDEEEGARHLVCSRCDSTWRYRRIGCPFCETTDHTNIQYYPSDDEVYRLYVCHNCQRYLKTIDLRRAGRAPLPATERVTTVAMDAAARQEGFR